MSGKYSTAKQELLERLLRGEKQFQTSLQAISKREHNQHIPLSFAQEQIWLHAQLVPDLPLYNEPVTIHYSGELDPAALERSFNEILRRHEAWRTCFPTLKGEPFQEVKPKLTVSLPVIDLRTLPEEHRNQAALLLAHEDARTPLDLAQAPLFRAKLIRLDEHEYRLYLTLSHIIFDGVAIYRVFLPELVSLYRDYGAGNSSPLPEITIQYPDYAIWQRHSMRPELIAEQMAYWKKQLGSGLPLLDLPLDRPRPPLQSFRGSMHVFVVGSELTASLKRIGSFGGVTLFQTLLAAFAALLGRYSGQDDFAIGSVTAGRNRPELNHLLGYFLNTVVLRADLSGDPSFSELMRRMRRLTLEALQHDRVPWGQLIQQLAPHWDRSRNPLFQVMFSLEPPMPEVDPAWRLTQMDVDTGATKYDLYLELDERPEGILGRFHYSTDLFDPTTIARMAQHWLTMLEAAANNPQLRVSQLHLLSQREREQILIEWNQTQADYPENESIQQRFLAQCNLTPDAIAVREPGRQLTFSELRDRSFSLAEYLCRLGAGPGTRVALALERSIDMIVGLLGILETGAAYVPLDPDYPSERLAFMLEDSQAGILITQEKFVSKVPPQDAHLICLDSEWDDIISAAQNSPSSLLVVTQPHDIAYVLYTSGSTGKPKGVEGTQRACLNRLAWMWREYPFQAGEMCCQKTNVGFVDSVWEIFGPLLAGVPSVIVPQETLHDPELLLQSLAHEQVTRMVVVPSLLRMLLDHAPRLGERVPELKLWSCSGEVLPVELAERFRRGFPEARLLNLYGSSEVAADVTCQEVGEADCAASSISIGRPISNTQIYILDEQGNPVPVGVRGEIYVGGAGLARGYWRRPELTAERFVANPFAAIGSAAASSSRLFRTGDAGRFRSTGEIEYAGRMDNQVKLRGMRMELGEIEAVLRSHPRVGEGMVGVSGEGEQAGLVAYVRFAEAEKEPAIVGAGELRRYMRSKLPEHMVPASYREVEHWPLLPSGKVDRRAVAAMATVALAEGESWAAPRTEVERKLAAIWEELLKVQLIGIEQNFFELGGHSLLALQVMARIRSQFEVELGVRILFEGATIAGLAAEVEKAQKLGVKARAPILPRRARAASSPEALLAQLDNLSASELQSLLQRALQSKGP
ncbi:MAG: amino acid adenylation domain-containing protein, partial [Candidatus Sulfotelmatobacter sp.]